MKILTQFPRYMPLFSYTREIVDCNHCLDSGLHKLILQPKFQSLNNPLQYPNELFLFIGKKSQINNVAHSLLYTFNADIRQSVQHLKTEWDYNSYYFFFLLQQIPGLDSCRYVRPMPFAQNLFRCLLLAIAITKLAHYESYNRNMTLHGIDTGVMFSFKGFL